MLEIGIIVCLALVLFIILRNFPKTKSNESPEPSDNSSIKENKFGGWFSRRESTEEMIKQAIERDNEKVIAPKEINEARRAYNESDPDLAKLLYEADEAFIQNDLRQSEDLAIEALSKDKKCAHAYVIIGKVAFHRGSFDDAKASLMTALRCEPELGEAYFILGQLELRGENFSQALDYLQKSVNIDRGCPEWYAELGKAFMQVRQFAKAAKALKRAASLDIDNREYRELASEAEEKQRMHSKAYRFKK